MAIRIIADRAKLTLDGVEIQNPDLSKCVFESSVGAKDRALVEEILLVNKRSLYEAFAIPPSELDGRPRTGTEILERIREREARYAPKIEFEFPISVRVRVCAGGKRLFFRLLALEQRRRAVLKKNRRRARFRRKRKLRRKRL